MNFTGATSSIARMTKVTIIVTTQKVVEKKDRTPNSIIQQDGKYYEFHSHVFHKSNTMDTELEMNTTNLTVPLDDVLKAVCIIVMRSKEQQEEEIQKIVKIQADDATTSAAEQVVGEELIVDEAEEEQVGGTAHSKQSSKNVLAVRMGQGVNVWNPNKSGKSKVKTVGYDVILSDSFVTGEKEMIKVCQRIAGRDRHLPGEGEYYCVLALPLHRALTEGNKIDTWNMAILDAQIMYDLLKLESTSSDSAAVSSTTTEQHIGRFTARHCLMQHGLLEFAVKQALGNHLKRSDVGDLTPLALKIAQLRKVKTQNDVKSSCSVVSTEAARRIESLKADFLNASDNTQSSATAICQGYGNNPNDVANDIMATINDGDEVDMQQVFKYSLSHAHESKPCAQTLNAVAACSSNPKTGKPTSSTSASIASMKLSTNRVEAMKQLFKQAFLKLLQDHGEAILSYTGLDDRHIMSPIHLSDAFVSASVRSHHVGRIFPLIQAPILQQLQGSSVEQQQQLFVKLFQPLSNWIEYIPTNLKEFYDIYGNKSTFPLNSILPANKRKRQLQASISASSSSPTHHHSSSQLLPPAASTVTVVNDVEDNSGGANKVTQHHDSSAALKAYDDDETEQKKKVTKKRRQQQQTTTLVDLTSSQFNSDEIDDDDENEVFELCTFNQSHYDQHHIQVLQPSQKHQLQQQQVSILENQLMKKTIEAQKYKIKLLLNGIDPDESD